MASRKPFLSLSKRQQNRRVNVKEAMLRQDLDDPLMDIDGESSTDDSRENLQPRRRMRIARFEPIEPRQFASTNAELEIVDIAGENTRNANQQYVQEEEIVETLNDFQEVQEQSSLEKNSVRTFTLAQLKEQIEACERILPNREEFETSSVCTDEDDADEVLQDDDDADEVLQDEDVEEEPSTGVAKLRNFCLQYLPDRATKQLIKIVNEISDKRERCPNNFDDFMGVDPEGMPIPVPIEGGEYMHLGIRTNLKMVTGLKNLPACIECDFSWDGVTLHKASKTQIWPLCMNICNVPEAPVMLIGVFVGEGKPLNPIEFFHCLVEEMKIIHEGNSAVVVGPNKLQRAFKGRLYISDKPAATWALGMYMVPLCFFLNCQINFEKYQMQLTKFERI